MPRGARTAAADPASRLGAGSEEEKLSVRSKGFSASGCVLSLLHRQWLQQGLVHGGHDLITRLLLLSLLLFALRKVEAFRVTSPTSQGPELGSALATAAAYRSSTKGPSELE